MLQEVMWSKKISSLVVLGSITGLVITGLIGSAMMATREPDPLSLPFNERWIFNATLDQISYHPGDNMALTVQLICLIDHRIENYVITATYRAVENSSSSVPTCSEKGVTCRRPVEQEVTVVWCRPRSSSITYKVYEFHKGDNFSHVEVYHLGTTEEIPEDYQLDFDKWIAPLHPGNYVFVASAPAGIGGGSVRIPFMIEGNETVINYH